MVCDLTDQQPTTGIIKYNINMKDINMEEYCIISNTEKDVGRKYARRVMELLSEAGKKCDDITQRSHRRDEEDYIDKERLEKKYDCAVVLGGDGTIIRSARELARKGIPILGINIGTLGYLAAAEGRELKDALNAVLNGNFRVEERMMVTGSIYSLDTLLCRDIALNDLVISRNGYSRIITVNVYVNDEFVDQYKGDGMIISTPTGSTGYNLSAGGPIVKHDSEVTIITPICPHSRSARSVVVPSQDKISVELVESKKTREDEAIVSFDGRSGIQLGRGARVDIKRADTVAKLIVINDKTFFDVVNKKL